VWQLCQLLYTCYLLTYLLTILFQSSSLGLLRKTLATVALWQLILSICHINRVVGTSMVICLERGADLHMAQLMPLPFTISCFSKIQIGFTFLVPAHPGSPGQRAIKRVCVCVCVKQTSLAIDSGGRLFLLMNNRFSTILLNLAFVLRARNLYSCKHNTTIVTVNHRTITCL